MRAFPVVAALALVTGVGIWAGCTDLGIGAVCLNPREDGKVQGTNLSSPALECRSRLCLLQEKDAAGTALDPPRATCTSRCDSDNDCGDALVADKEKPDARQCPHGKKFICAVATLTGPFACTPICICEEDVAKAVAGDNSVPNLEGRVVCPGACVTDPAKSAKCEAVRKNLRKK